jgi:hypothetical protein
MAFKKNEKIVLKKAIDYRRFFQGPLIPIGTIGTILKKRRKPIPGIQGQTYWVKFTWIEDGKEMEYQANFLDFQLTEHC